MIHFIEKGNAYGVFVTALLLAICWAGPLVYFPMRLELNESSVTIRRWGRRGGHVEDFLCWSSNESRQMWQLVKLEDLQIVEVRYFMDREVHETIGAWIERKIPRGHLHGADAISSKGAQLSEQLALRMLAEPFDKTSKHLDGDIDLRFAQAARSAWRFRYHRALPLLHALLLELPNTIFSKQYIIEAVRRLGDHDSVEVLRQAIEHPSCPTELAVRALTELAGPEHRHILEGLSTHDSPFVKAITLRALGHVGDAPTAPSR